MTDEPYMQVRLVARSRDEFERAVDSVPIVFGCAGPRLRPGGEVVANALIQASSLERLQERKHLIEIDVRGNFTDNLAARRKEVGTGNRFADPAVLPQGYGVVIPGEGPR